MDQLHRFAETAKPRDYGALYTDACLNMPNEEIPPPASSSNAGGRLMLARAWRAESTELPKDAELSRCGRR